MEAGLTVNMIKLFRVPHYLKNAFIFLPIFFSGQVLNYPELAGAALAFLCFSLVASSVYIFNDIIDVPEDRIHPDKRNRPIASGQISPAKARITEIVLLIVGLSVSLFISVYLTYVLVAYKLINIGYSLLLKRLVVIDVLTIATGFVLRLLAGSVATGIVLTHWIIILTFLLAVLIALGKRYVDAQYSVSHKIKLRKVMSNYSLPFLRAFILLIAVAVIICYYLYSIDAASMNRIGTNYLFVTCFWVIAGISRYLWLLLVKKASKSPVSLLLNDAPIQSILLLWVLNFIYFIYF